MQIIMKNVQHRKNDVQTETYCPKYRIQNTKRHLDREL